MKLLTDPRRAAIAAFFLLFVPPIQAAEPVIAPDNGAGTISFPVLNEDFSNGTRVRKGMQDVRATEPFFQISMERVRITSVTSRVPDPASGSERQTCSALAVFVFEPNDSSRRVIEVPVTVVTESAAPSPGSAVQDFDCDMVRLEGELFGDPDFDLLRVRGGSDFGLPSPGHTTLTRLGPPGSDFAVDSFFDIFYEVEFQGAPGGTLGGLGGTRQDNGLCEQPLKILNGVVYETTGSTTAVRTPDGVLVSDGGGGGGVIRLGREDVPSESFSLNFEEIKWDYFENPTSGGLTLPDDGDALTLDLFVRELDKSSPKLCEAVCSTSGGSTSCTVDFSSLGATGTRVEVWHLGQLVGSAVVPNGTAACILPPRDFDLRTVYAGTRGGGITGSTRRSRGDTTLGDVVVVKELDKSTPKLMSTPGGDFLGSELRFYPVGATVRVGGVHHVDHACNRIVVIDDNSVRIYGREVRGLGDSGLSKADSKRGRLKVSNLGSSGCDGVSIDLGDDGTAPVRMEFEEFAPSSVGGGGAGGSIWLHARTAGGASLGEVQLTGGGGAGGRVLLADFSSISSPTALVRVYQDDTLIGETQVPLTGATQVASLADGPDGPSSLRACGKNELLPPVQLPCFFAEFDRATLITPQGAAGALSGNRLEILADGVPGPLDPLQFFDLLCDDPHPILISDILHEPDKLPTWIWDPLSPPLPPLVHIVCGRPAIFDTSGSAGLPPGSEGLEFRVQISDLVEIGPSPTGSGTLFDCTVEIAASGYGGKKGYDYYRALSAPCVIDTGTNAFDGEDVQQFDTEMLSMDLAIPLPDPDFAFLRVRCGADLGLPPCPGQVTRTRLPSGNFNVDSFFDITYEISFQGGQGGPLSGASGFDTFSSRWQMYQPQYLRWGLIHEELGEATLELSPSGGLRVSNLGSSGCDGVSVDFGGAQGGTIVFEPHDMLPGASMRCEVFGDAAGLPVSSSLGHVEVARAAAPDSFFDITYDLSFGGGTNTCVQVLNNGVVVSETIVPAATGALRLDPLVPGGDTPPVRACGKLPGLGGPSCYVVVFDELGSITPPGGAPVDGDEVRMLEVEVRRVGVEFARCLITADAPWDIERSSLVMHGRNVSGEDGSQLSCWDGVCRVSPPSCPSSLPFRCGDGACGISSLACGSPPAPDVLIVVISPRDAASGLPSGKRQHKPLTVSTNGPGITSPGEVFTVRMTGTAGGISDQTIGEVELQHSGDQVLTSVQWPYELSAETRVMIRENPLYEEAGNTAQNPLFDGVAPAGSPPVLIDAAAPVLIQACGAAPGDDNPLNLPAYVCVSFVEPVSMTAPDGGTYLAREVLFIPEGVGLPPVEDVQRLTLSGVGNVCYDIKAVVTGPTWHTGLSHQSYGSCDLETDGSGRLVVSNIGSSGDDGVVIDLQEGQGARVEMEPCPLVLPQGGLRVGVRSLTDLNRDGLPDLVVSSNNDGSSCSLRMSGVQLQQRVVCRDSSGQAVGDFLLPPDNLGVCSPGIGGGLVELEVCGVTPHFVSSLGNTEAGPYLQFVEPVTFTASSGQSVECRSLYVHCPDPVWVQYRETDYHFVCRFSSLPDQTLSVCHVCHLISAPHSSLGEARLRADSDTLTVSNIGSSGLDGVSIDLEHAGSFSTGGSGGEDRLTENVTLNFQPLPLRFNIGSIPSGGGGAGKVILRTTGSFDPNGGPPVELGVCALDTDSDNDSLPVEADFSSLGTTQSRVVMLQDGQVVGQFVHGDVRQPVIVGRVRQAGPAAPSLTGCGKLRAEQIPGGWQPPCFVWIFDVPVEVSPPGAPAGGGFVGNELRVLAEGATVPQVAGLYEFELRLRDLPSLTLTGLPRNDFSSWLALHFSPAEIDQLAAQNFEGDFDNDGCSDVCEAVTGRDPRVADAVGSEALAGSTGTGGDGEDHFRLSYVTGDLEDFDLVLRSTTNLQNWNPDPTQFRLIERSELPDGRTQWTWEDVSRMSDSPRKFYGHVTILK